MMPLMNTVSNKILVPSSFNLFWAHKVVIELLRIFFFDFVWILIRRHLSILHGCFSLNRLKTMIVYLITGCAITLQMPALFKKCFRARIPQSVTFDESIWWSNSSITDALLKRDQTAMFVFLITDSRSDRSWNVSFVFV